MIFTWQILLIAVALFVQTVPSETPVTVEQNQTQGEK